MTKNACGQRLAEIAALLVGNLSQARQRFAILAHRKGKIAKHIDIVETWHGEVRRHGKPALRLEAWLGLLDT